MSETFSTADHHRPERIPSTSPNMKPTIRLSVYGALISLLMITVEPFPAVGATVDVQAFSNFFIPSGVNVNVNDTVHWVNMSGSHNVVSSSIPEAFSASVFPFSTFDVTFTIPGTYSYYCAPHLSVGMVGSVTVTTVATPPTVNITSPGASTLVNDPATLTITAAASATTQGASVSKVEFFIDGNLFATAFSSPYTGDLVSPSLGFHSVTAVVTDTVGGTATSQSISVVVNALPTVSITNLVNRSVFAAPATFVVKAAAADVDGTVTKVEFFNNGASLGTATGPDYQKTISNLPNGTYLMSVVATDDRGTTASTELVVIVTTLRLTLPTFSSGQFGMQLNGLVNGKAHIVQTSTNLVNWISIATNAANQATRPFTDVNATNAFKYYRFIQLP